MRTLSSTLESVISARRLFLVALLLVLALVVTGCGRRPVPPEVEMTPVSGSVDAPAEDAATGSETVTDTVDAGSATTEEGATTENETAAPAGDAGDGPEAEAQPESITAGQQVVIVAETGAPLRADATADAQVLHRYSAGEPMEVLEPSGDYDAYPVADEEGVQWVRVRAADGLVGWVLAESIGAAQ